MSINSINKINFAWQNKLAQIMDVNKKPSNQTKHPPDSAFPKAENTIKDSVEISSDAKEKARTLLDEMEDMVSSYRELMEQLENARKQSEAAGEAIDAKMKCLVIAMRIMAGDNVPNADYRYLAKNDIELYMKAVSMRREREHPQKHKRLSKDEEPSGGSDETSRSLDVEAIAPESGEIKAQAAAGSSETPAKS